MMSSDQGSSAERGSMAVQETGMDKTKLPAVNPSTSVSNSDLSLINSQRENFKNKISSDLIVSPTPAKDRPQDIHQETADSRRNVLLKDDPLRNLWDYIDFRDAFSDVLNVKYVLCARGKYWPHLAEKFGINQAIYETFSTSDINSPTETLFEYLEATQPIYKVHEFCKDCKTAEALEVSRFVEEKIKDGTLNRDDLVSEICDKAPLVLDVIVLKLDRDRKLWQELGRIRGIPRKTYMGFQSQATTNPARLFFDVLRMQGPEITIGNFKEKSREVKLERIPHILEKFKILDTTLLSDLSRNSPDAKSEIESLLNNPKTDFLWKLASLYQKEGKMEDIELEMVFRRQEDVHSPTSSMMEYVLARLPQHLTIEDLIVKLWNINRKDCFDIIQPYLRRGKEDIDEITKKLVKFDGQSSEGRKQPSTVDELASGVPPSDGSEGNNQYVRNVPHRSDI